MLRLFLKVTHVSCCSACMPENDSARGRRRLPSPSKHAQPARAYRPSRVRTSTIILKIELLGRSRPTYLVEDTSSIDQLNQKQTTPVHVIPPGACLTLGGAVYSAAETVGGTNCRARNNYARMRLRCLFSPSDIAVQLVSSSKDEQEHKRHAETQHSTSTSATSISRGCCCVPLTTTPGTSNSTAAHPTGDTTHTPTRRRIGSSCGCRSSYTPNRQSALETNPIDRGSIVVHRSLPPLTATASAERRHAAFTTGLLPPNSSVSAALLYLDRREKAASQPPGKKKKDREASETDQKRTRCMRCQSLWCSFANRLSYCSSCLLPASLQFSLHL